MVPRAWETASGAGATECRLPARGSADSARRPSVPTPSRVSVAVVSVTAAHAEPLNELSQRLTPLCSCPYCLHAPGTGSWHGIHRRAAGEAKIHPGHADQLLFPQPRPEALTRNPSTAWDRRGLAAPEDGRHHNRWTDVSSSGETEAEFAATRPQERTDCSLTSCLDWDEAEEEGIGRAAAPRSGQTPRAVPTQPPLRPLPGTGGTSRHRPSEHSRRSHRSRAPCLVTPQFWRLWKNG